MYVLKRLFYSILVNSVKIFCDFSPRFQNKALFDKKGTQEWPKRCTLVQNKTKTIKQYSMLLEGVRQFSSQSVSTLAVPFGLLDELIEKKARTGCG